MWPLLLCTPVSLLWPTKCTSEPSKSFSSYRINSKKSLYKNMALSLAIVIDSLRIDPQKANEEFLRQRDVYVRLTQNWFQQNRQEFWFKTRKQDCYVRRLLHLSKSEPSLKWPLVWAVALHVIVCEWQWTVENASVWNYPAMHGKGCERPGGGGKKGLEEVWIRRTDDRRVQRRGWSWLSLADAWEAVCFAPNVNTDPLLRSVQPGKVASVSVWAKVMQPRLWELRKELSLEIQTTRELSRMEMTSLTCAIRWSEQENATTGRLTGNWRGWRSQFVRELPQVSSIWSTTLENWSSGSATQHLVSPKDPHTRIWFIYHRISLTLLFVSNNKCAIGDRPVNLSKWWGSLSTTSRCRWTMTHRW